MFCSTNNYHDVIINKNHVPDSENELCALLQKSMKQTNENNFIIWIEIQPSKTDFLPLLYEIGFKNHHVTNEQNLMMAKWVGKDVNMPIFGTHLVRVEAILLRWNPKDPRIREVLVVKERFSRSAEWKLPSGCVRPQEFLGDAVTREMKEEVNMDVIPKSVVGYGSYISEKAGRNQIFFCYHVEPGKHCNMINDEIKYQESELLDARWMSTDEIFECWKKSWKPRVIQIRSLVAAMNDKVLIPYESREQRAYDKVKGHTIGVPHYCVPPSCSNRVAPNSFP